MAENPQEAISQTDPCKRARQFRAIRDLLITGGATAEYEYEEGNGVKRRVKYNTADFDRLDREIASADAACAASGGENGNSKPKRFAVGRNSRRCC